MDLSGTKVNELVSINFICKNAEVREFKTNLGVSDSPLRNGSYSLPVSKCFNIKAQIFRWRSLSCSHTISPKSLFVCSNFDTFVAQCGVNA